MAQAAANQSTATGRYVINGSSLTTEGWTAIIVLSCLALLIALRMGFRGVNVLGASVRVG
jgi:hypothetical protein